MTVRIYHNPRCSKSRQTLALLEARDVDVDVINYIETPLSKAALRSLLSKLGLQARDIVRTNEAEFKESGLTLEAGEDELLDLMAKHPKTMQRPIVEAGGRARLGRPPEQVLEIID